MSTISTTPTTLDPHGHDPHGGHGNGHDPHLAHHFDTPEQQMASGKLGMWVFLATEILMFGGLFCAYSVYRHNHPDVFEFAHQYLDKSLGAINTLRGLWLEPPRDGRILAISSAESIVPLYVSFSCLMLAWLLVAAGMRRRANP